MSFSKKYELLQLQHRLQKSSLLSLLPLGNIINGLSYSYLLSSATDINEQTTQAMRMISHAKKENVEHFKFSGNKNVGLSSKINSSTGDEINFNLGRSGDFNLEVKFKD